MGIDLKSGTMYFRDSDGGFHELGELKEIEFEPDAAEDDILAVIKDFDCSFECSIEPSPEALQCLKELAEQFREVFEKVMEITLDIMEITLDIWNDTFKPLLDAAWEALKKYQNKRVIHLAAHGRSERVRKKNIHRIENWLFEWMEHFKNRYEIDKDGIKNGN